MSTWQVKWRPSERRGGIRGPERVIGWANLAVKNGELKAELGYVESLHRASARSSANSKQSWIACGLYWALNVDLALTLFLLRQFVEWERGKALRARAGDAMPQTLMRNEQTCKFAGMNCLYKVSGIVSWAGRTGFTSTTSTSEM